VVWKTLPRAAGLCARDGDGALPHVQLVGEKRGNRTLAIVLPMLSVVLLILELLGILSCEVLALTREWSQIQGKIEPLAENIHRSLKWLLGLADQDQKNWIRESISKWSASGVSILSKNNQRNGCSADRP